MEAIKRKCRPKHQVLVLRCYPRTTKGAVDIKPNSSELSYLLFYATSRRSKIQKIGAFLEKRTAHDVWRQRVGNVQVTLQILAAIIEKSPKDLPLIAPCVLRVLDLILDSKDIVMTESSIPTFQTFCAHHDAISLFADQTYIDQHVSVVNKYTTLASSQTDFPGASVPVTMRWRHVGLDAIMCLASSDVLSSPVSRQLETTVPIILENIWTDNDEFIDVLVSRLGMEEKEDPEKLGRRRSSAGTIRTSEGNQAEPNSVVAAGTAVDVDKLAEEDIGVLAMQCLKQIYIVPNRLQISTATKALFKFIDSRVSCGDTVVVTNDYKTSSKDGGWAIRIFDLIARWATVQDRYVIVVTAMDTLSRESLRHDNLTRNFILVSMIASLLRSDINLIGLSVMDVLVGLMQYMKKIARLPDDFETSSITDAAAKTIAQKKMELLAKVQMCIGGLATHIYYADQISDMILAMLIRLRSARSGSFNASPHGENETDDSPENATSVVTTKQLGTADSSDPSPTLETYFVSNQGRIAALKAIKEVLLIANPQTRTTNNKTLSRNKVSIQVWEGTHWLLRDPDGQVRKAYVDAFSVWLDRETASVDSRAHDDFLWQRNLLTKSQDTQGNNHTQNSRRAVSVGVSRDPVPTTAVSRFLQLIHLAAYDNALQYVDFETDFLLLHVLLSKMASRLGVNAVRFGLAMIFRLQEDILEVDAPIHKVRIGCLCHGYFWAVKDKFVLDGSMVGQAIANEVSRRRSKHFWIEGLNVPPPPVELCGTPGLTRPQPRMPIQEIESEALLPFDDRLTLVDAIASSYQATGAAPSSPTTSTGGEFFLPVAKVPVLENSDDTALPDSFREQLLSDWTRETTLLGVQSASTSASVNGSRTAGSARHRIVINGGAHNPPSPRGSHYANSRPISSNGGLMPMQKQRKNSVRSTSRAPSASSRGYVASVDQLKQVLSGQPVTVSRAARGDSDDESESMISFEVTPSENSFNPLGVSHMVDNSDAYMSKTSLSMARPGSRGSKGSRGSGTAPPLTMNPTRPTSSSRSIDEASDPERPERSEVPPVPPLPKLTTTFTPPQSTTATHRGHAHGHPDSDANILRTASLSSHKGCSGGVTRMAPRSRNGTINTDSFYGGNSDAAAGSMNLQDLLSHIDSRTGELSLSGVTRPPY
ncbi:plasma membrane localization protein [Ceratocystis pirilliformis]|uniref:Plasma membrane localization protein n=1 Tax=Ceratocystis pirilliformis TaxID=259994 RepID=A0ABR3Z2Y5_9PEZI